MSAFAFNANADNVNTRYVINADAWVDYYEDISGTYLDRDGHYQSITFHAYSSSYYQNAVTDMWYDNIHYNPNGKKLVNYVSDVTADLVYDDYQQFKVVLYPNIHFSSCEYFEFGISTYITPNFQSFCARPYQSVKPYNYFQYNIPSIDYTEQIFVAGEQGMQYPFNALHSSGGSGYTGMYGFGAYQSETEFVIDEIDLSGIMNQSGDPLYLSVFLPTVSENTVLESPYIPPVTTSPEVVSGTAVGSGSIVTNGSGVTEFNFNITNEFQVPEYLQSGSFSEYSDNFPQTVSGLVSDMDTYGTAAASDIAEMDDYDLSGFWDFFGRMIPLRVVAAILAVSWISLLGWILTKYRG